MSKPVNKERGMILEIAKLLSDLPVDSMTSAEFAIAKLLCRFNYGYCVQPDSNARLPNAHKENEETFLSTFTSFGTKIERD